ncbi:MAG: prepilin-type N-terminal cleavage/methylation domain-containing protein [Armatimonadetes bacterium]|nr:prepilin-type N-terminal cleavage/methylation domain-containing protein [Armatimonadota bacterium]
MRIGLRSRRGMSLVEGVVALAILSMSFLGALQILITVQGLDTRQSSRLLAIQLAQQRMEELKAMASGDVQVGIPLITYNNMDSGVNDQRDFPPNPRRALVTDYGFTGGTHPLSRIGCRDPALSAAEQARCRSAYRNFYMSTQIQDCNDGQGGACGGYLAHKVFTVWVFYPRPEGGGEDNVLLTTYAARKF